MAEHLSTRRLRIALVLAGAVAIACAAQSVLLPAAATATGQTCGENGATLTCGASSSSGTSSSGTSSGTSSGSNSSSSGTSPCTWITLNAVDAQALGLPTMSGQNGYWEAETCPDMSMLPPAGPDVVIWEGRNTAFIWVVPGAGAPVSTGPTAEQVAQQAANSIRLPSPTLDLNPSPDGVVNLPEWLAIDSSIWHPYSVSASVQGVGATATATPVSVQWKTGDGGSTSCAGPGVIYAENESPDAQSTYCSHTYVQSSWGQPSPDGNPEDASYEVTASVEWDVTWSATGNAQGGTLAPITTSASAWLPVMQIQSVEAG